MIWTLWCPSASSASRISADAAVHHVAGRDDVRARRGLVERLVDQHRRRSSSLSDIAGGIDQPVMPVAGIGIERDVGQHADLRHRILDRADRAAHQIVGVERLARRRRCAAARGVLGNSATHGMPRSRASFAARDDPVDRPARDAGQRRDRLLHPLPFGDEQRPDQVGGGQHRLGVEARLQPAARVRRRRSAG